MSQSDPKMKSSPKNEARFSARLSAVQAVYEVSLNKRPLKEVAKDYKEQESLEFEGDRLEAPDFIHFKNVLFGVDERLLELEPILTAHLKPKNEEVEKGPEALLKAILLCGIYEILACPDIDSPIIINDYLNVTHGFYSKNEASLVNGILDTVTKLLREAV